MIRLAVDIDFSRNTSSEPYNSYLKLSCFNINSNTISFTLLLVYQLIKSKNTTKNTISISLSAITSKITSPKTTRSNRTIQLPSKIVEKLKQRYIIVS